MSQFLQSYVIPVCLYEEQSGAVFIREFLGTAFFVNSRGLFLTAAHVLKNALLRSTTTGWKIGLCQNGEEGLSPNSVMCPIREYEFAEKPYDIAIGISTMPSETLLTLTQLEVSAWQDVATLGYPSSIAGGDVERFDIGLRCLKGYVQRVVQPGEIKVAFHPISFELSFPVSSGLSGSPLFVHRTPKDILVGVCVGSIRFPDRPSVVIDHLGGDVTLNKRVSAARRSRAVV